MCIPALLAAFCAMPMQTGDLAVAPRGFIGFCIEHQEDCGRRSSPVTVELTDDRLSELRNVQWNVNHTLAPVSRIERWDYPADRKGDCNRYALEKRRELIALGWPAEALLLTVAIVRGEGHLVLTVTTSQGDLVLDNLQRGVVDWRALPYRFVERRSASNAAEWVGIL
jgi:predicted transglutaminase-like cysteine proteinase